jgi:acyl-CoA reductase-like NAD-dependent aldehyde dehydrogenase
VGPDDDRRAAALARGLRAVIVTDLDGIVARITAATGKPDLEALTGDVLTTLDTLAYLEEHTETVLASEPRPGHRLAPRSEFRVDYEPLGVVGVIAPWNYPLQLAMLPLVTALAAGNAVVLKPSELVPSVGALIAELCARAGLPPGVVQVVQGGPEVGAALVAARPDKLFFTGSVATGKKIVAAAAEHLVPLELELGGKDPMLVFADAPFERAVNGACTAPSSTPARPASPSSARTSKRRSTSGSGGGDGGGAGAPGGQRPRRGPRPAHQAGAVRAGGGTPRRRLRQGARLTTPRERLGNRFRPLVCAT